MTQHTLAFLGAILPLTAFSQNLRTDIQSLVWLAGFQEGIDADGDTVSPLWMKPLGNSMKNISRVVENGTTIAYRRGRPEQTDCGAFRYFAHLSGRKESSFTR